MTKKSRQKFKHFENKKSFQDDEIKSNFHHFSRAFIEANKKKFVWKKDPCLAGVLDRGTLVVIMQILSLVRAESGLARRIRLLWSAIY